MKRLPAILAAPLLAACILPAPPGPPALRPPPTQVAAAFGKTWDAAIDELTNGNISIRDVDRSSGLIATDRLKLGPDVGDVADCGTDVIGIRLDPTDASYNILVRGDSTRSTVRVNARWFRFRTNHGASSDRAADECSTKGAWEAAMEARIKAAAESAR